MRDIGDLKEEDIFIRIQKEKAKRKISLAYIRFLTKSTGHQYQPDHEYQASCLGLCVAVHLVVKKKRLKEKKEVRRL